MTAPLFIHPSPFVVYAGAASGTHNLRNGRLQLAPGTYTFFVNVIMRVLERGSAAGGGGCGNFTNGDAGGGQGAYDVTGEVVTLYPGVTYTVVVGLSGAPGGVSVGGSPGGDTSLSSALGVLLLLGGGQGGSNGASAGAGGFVSVGAHGGGGVAGNGGNGSNLGGPGTVSSTGPDGNQYGAGGRGFGSSTGGSTGGLNGFLSLDLAA